jgi:hypothetical protein
MQLGGKNKNQNFQHAADKCFECTLIPPVNVIIYIYMDYVMSASRFFLQQIYCNCKLLLQLKDKKRVKHSRSCQPMLQLQPLCHQSTLICTWIMLPHHLPDTVKILTVAI